MYIKNNYLLLYKHRSSTMYSCHGPSVNPWSSHVRKASLSKNEEKEQDWNVCGGSSGGSAVAVAAGMCDLYVLVL